jgi:anti-sigma regulatory factor (Ser/Thr protein kinase)
VTHELELGPQATSPREARRFVSSWARSWGYSELAETAALLTSELVTNAVLHVGSPLLVEVDDLHDGLRVAVHDRSPDPPTMRAVADVDVRGRGLLIVDAFATSWGIDDDELGKEVWFEIATAS